MARKKKINMHLHPTYLYRPILLIQVQWLKTTKSWAGPRVGLAMLSAYLILHFFSFYFFKLNYTNTNPCALSSFYGTPTLCEFLLKETSN